MSKFITRTAELAEQQRQAEESAFCGIDSVKQVLAVASGKGGVGKTTIAVNLALALAGSGMKVGLLDADIYGPNVPIMLGLQGSPRWEGKVLIPEQKFGLSVISIGMLSETGQAIAWRGPMVDKALSQLLFQVQWGELDYLIVDLPPGTGDSSMAVAQYIPECSVLMVTTPQEVALSDVRRAIELFRKFDLKNLGLIENMSYFMCEHSTDPIELLGIFGAGGGQRLSEESGLPLLATIPIMPEIAQAGDSGTPLLVSAPDSDVGQIFQAVAEKIISGANEPEETMELGEG
ncbi:MAG: Mrp/NBP35 family ATP-binding protein [Deltaproteobacteria bacterium]|jgi:ATP-binding protein involved in chromosome partitioning|nr:Mrp/NBP35 family ATP-binding protein [Deltaproteobacteria bacterium]MCW8892088.1 Mrp/NBP35 family ATP-binding protein [Deltaproteobacteria bacterium]MCW9049064.1 Mrp/NBP35 family ATP-binding protein [Deltaproteobacteria bacterium]